MDREAQDPQTYAVIGAAMEVQRELGHGFKESVYHEAFLKEAAKRGIPLQHEPEITVYYKGEKLDSTFRPDFVCFGDVVVEFKAASTLTDVDFAQLLNYLKATGLRRELLINFGAKSLQVKRAVLDL
ncbi:MAG: GxxExxY protein [Planctomycetes bacterium]|nr:GxxExxY protein [Planctomycetota bacterium]MCW8136221.1 GxxExxY protein [Planctomycetota bacterium]